MSWAIGVGASILLAAGVVATSAEAVVNVPHGVVFDEPGFAVVSNWRGSTLGVPGRLGGLVFSPSGDTLYVVGNAGTSSSGLWALGVTRSATTQRVTNLVGPAVLVFTGTFASLDAGLERGPGGHLFHTYFTPFAFGAPRWVAYRAGGVGGAESLLDLGGFDEFTNRGLGGLTFNPLRPDPGSGFGRMLVNDGVSETVVEVDLAPDGAGGWTAVDARPWVRVETRTNQGGLGQMHTLPAPFAGDVMYASYTDGELRIVAVDPASGVPFVEPSCTPTCLPQLGTLNPVDTRFAHGFGEDVEPLFNPGPLGLEIDPVGGDLFVTTSDGSPANVIFQIGGFAPPTPTTTVPTTSTSTTTISSTSTSATTTSSTSTSTSIPLPTTSTSSSTSTTSSAPTTTSTSTSTTFPVPTTTTSSSTSTSRPATTTTTSLPATSTSTPVTTTTTTTLSLPGVGCGGTPRSGCVQAGRALLSVKELRPGYERLKLVLRRLEADLQPSDFGDPATGVTRYDLCVWNGPATLAVALTVDRAGGTCTASGAPCWVAVGGKGYRYKDRAATSDGVQRIVLRAGGAGRGKIVARAGNDAGKGQATFPAGSTATLLGADGVTVQVVSSDGVCVGRVLDDVSRAAAGVFKASAR